MALQECFIKTLCATHCVIFFLCPVHSKACGLSVSGYFKVTSLISWEKLLHLHIYICANKLYDSQSFWHLNVYCHWKHTVVAIRSYIFLIWPHILVYLDIDSFLELTRIKPMIPKCSFRYLKVIIFIHNVYIEGINN